jgi:hypothetical protein
MRSRCFFFSFGRRRSTSASLTFSTSLPSLPSPSPHTDPHERQPPSHLLSLLCWADVIPKQPAGGAFSHSEDSETVLVDFKTLSSSTLSSSTLLEGLFLRSGPLSFSSSSSLPPPLFRLVDVRPLGKAGRVPSATRVVVRQERLPRGKEGKSGSSSVSISKEALSVVLSNALVEAGSAIFPAGVASFAAEEEPVYSFLYLLRVVEVEPRESGASRVVRSTKVELEP